MDTKRDQGPLFLAMPPFRERPAQAGTKQQAEAVGPGTSRTSRNSHSQVVRLLVLALTGWGQQRHSRQAGALLNCFYKNKNIVSYKNNSQAADDARFGLFFAPDQGPSRKLLLQGRARQGAGGGASKASVHP